MIDLGILDGDFVVVRQQPDANDGDVVVAGISGGEATVKTLRREADEVILVPANPSLSPVHYRSDEVTIFGKVVTVLRRM